MRLDFYLQTTFSYDRTCKSRVCGVEQEKEQKCDLGGRGYTFSILFHLTQPVLKNDRGLTFTLGLPSPLTETASLESAD